MTTKEEVVTVIVNEEDTPTAIIRKCKGVPVVYICKAGTVKQVAEIINGEEEKVIR